MQSGRVSGKQSGYIRAAVPVIWMLGIIQPAPHNYWKWFSAGGKQISLGDGYFYDFDTKAMDTNVNIIEVTKVIGYRK